MNETQDLLTAQQVADSAGVAKQTVLNNAKEGVISPILTLPNGQHYFDETAVPTLMMEYLGKICKNNKLVVMFGSADECQVFEEKYTQYLKEKNIPRVDNFAEVIQKYREAVKNNPMHKVVYMLESTEQTLRTCEKAISALPTDKPDVFESKRDQLERRYCREDMSKLSKDLAEGLKKKSVNLDYQPKTSAVKAIWKRVEQDYLREATKDYIKSKLSNGYVSVLCIDYQNERGIYKLIHCAMNVGISTVEIYGYDNTSLEVQEVIRYLKECRKVAIKDETGR